MAAGLAREAASTGKPLKDGFRLVVVADGMQKSESGSFAPEDATTMMENILHRVRILYSHSARLGTARLSFERTQFRAQACTSMNAVEAVSGCNSGNSRAAAAQHRFLQRWSGG